MTSNLEIFYFMQGPSDAETTPIRVVTIDDEPWFVVNDVCHALGIHVMSNGYVHTKQATNKLNEDEINWYPMSTQRGQLRETRVVSESGLYKLIMRSDKPIARKFQDWVTREVLPQMQKEKLEFLPEDNMNDVKLFEYTEQKPSSTFGLYEDITHEIRAVEIDGEPWFVAADVCRALDIYVNAKGQANTTMALDKLNTDEHGFTSIETIYRGSATRTHRVRVVNESGLYRLVMRSDKPNARRFQDWVVREVIPAIRKEGAYFTPEAEALAPDEVKQFRQTMQQAMAMIQEQATLNAALAPKAEAFEMLTAADEDIDANDH